MAVQRFELELVDAHMLTKHVRHMRFKRKDGEELNFTPGQFVTFLFDHTDGKVKRRSYSIATIPTGSDLIEIAIAYVDGGIATERLFNMKPGQTYNAMGPVGRLVLQDESVNQIILAGTGTGIAPYRAMLPSIAKRKDVSFYILQGAQYHQDLLYLDDFRAYAKDYDHIQYVSCLSRQDGDFAEDEVKGYIQQHFGQLQLSSEHDVVYLCGNPAMIDDAYGQLQEFGFTQKQVRREKYISSN